MEKGKEDLLYLAVVLDKFGIIWILISIWKSIADRD